MAYLQYKALSEGFKIEKKLSSTFNHGSLGSPGAHKYIHFA